MKSLKNYIEECVGGGAGVGGSAAGASVGGVGGTAPVSGPSAPAAAASAGIYATPGNTLGMGNPMMPGPHGEPGSGDAFPTAKLTKKQVKKLQKKNKYAMKNLLDEPK